MPHAFAFEPHKARILAAISFHFIEARIDYLAEVASALAAFPVATVEVVVFTNTGDPSERSVICSALSSVGLAAQVVSIKDLAHPFDLTWAHKELIKSSFVGKAEAFSHFIYLEDDERLSFANFCYFVEARQLLDAQGLIPSFARTEWRKESHCFVNTDNMQPVLLDGRAHVSDGSFSYIALDNPYCGSFILDQDLALEHVGSRSFDRLKSREVSVWDIRERAAMGLTFEAVPASFNARTVVPVDTLARIIPPRAWLAHLPSKYASDAGSGFGKIPMFALLSGTLDAFFLQD